LATSANFASFAATLRTLLDTAPPNIHVVFMGSSITDLRKLFQDPSAPFFNFASVLDFPPLDRHFIDFLGATFKQITDLDTDADALWKIFERVGRNAQILSGLVQRMVLLKTPDWQRVWSELEEELLGDEGWCAQTWQRLSPSDQAVYIRLLEGHDLFSEESLKRYEMSGFSRGTAQQALRRLSNQNLIHRTGHGEYERTVPLLDEWIRSRHLLP